MHTRTTIQLMSRGYYRDELGSHRDESGSLCRQQVFLEDSLMRRMPATILWNYLATSDGAVDPSRFSLQLVEVW